MCFHSGVCSFLSHYPLLSNHFWLLMTGWIFHVNGWKGWVMTVSTCRFPLIPQMEHQWLFIIISKPPRAPNKIQTAYTIPGLYFICPLMPYFFLRLLPALALPLSPWECSLKCITGFTTNHGILKVRLKNMFELCVHTRSSKVELKHIKCLQIKMFPCTGTWFAVCD